VLITKWSEYRWLDQERVRELMEGNVFVDLHNVYEHSVMSDYGLKDGREDRGG